MNPSADRTRRADPRADGEDRPVPLFVYGTLRRGTASASLLRDCRWEGVARVEGSLYDLGDYPALVLEPGGAVEGEVWWCPAETLPVLDAYEGVAEGLFERVKATVAEGWCWTYVAGPALRPRLLARRRLPAGRWDGRASGGPV